jgi:hypothetical protein
MINQIQSSIYTSAPAAPAAPAPKAQVSETPVHSGDVVEIGGHNPEAEGHQVGHHNVHHNDKHAYLNEGMKAIHVAAEVAHSAHAAGAIAGLAVGGAAAAGIYFGIEGVKDMGKAIEEKDVVEGVKATGHLALAAQAAINTAVEATHLSAISGAIGPTVTAALESPLTAALGLGFGVTYGAAELVVGGKEVYDGVKEGDRFKMLTGSIEMGMGTAVAAIAFGGGPVAGVTLAGLFAARMLMKNESVKELVVDLIGKEKADLINANVKELVNHGHFIKHVPDDIQ